MKTKVGYEFISMSIEDAAKRGAVVYIYDDGNFQVNAAGLTSAIEMAGHDIICEIDCRNIDEDAFDSDGNMFDIYIDEILEKFDDKLELV
jgi:hypothetical protein